VVHHRSPLPESHLIGLGDYPGGECVDQHNNRPSRHGKQLGMENIETERLIDQEVAEGTDAANDCRAAPESELTSDADGRGRCSLHEGEAEEHIHINIPDGLVELIPVPLGVLDSLVVDADTLHHELSVVLGPARRFGWRVGEDNKNDNAQDDRNRCYDEEDIVPAVETTALDLVEAETQEAGDDAADTDESLVEVYD
jgi:hypothetical protein